MCYRPTPTLHLNLALTGNFLHFYFLKKTNSVWLISVLKSVDMGQCPHKSPCPCNTYVIPVSLYKFMSSFVTKRHTHTHAHTTHVQTKTLCHAWMRGGLWEREEENCRETERSSPSLFHWCSRDWYIIHAIQLRVWDMKQKQGTYGQ